MRRLLLSCCAFAMSAGASFANCTPDAPAANGTVLCAGTDTNGFTSTANGLNVTVTGGATVSSATADALRVRGTGVTVTNAGTVAGLGASSDGIDGGDSLTVINTGTITAGSRGIDADARNNLTVINTGTIEATNKAIRNQNGLSGYLLNLGTITSLTNEGFESGDDAVVLNYGTITALDDAVQVNGNGTILNWGTIRGIGSDDDPQDGIDIDSGLIVNYAGGQILSDRDAGIDHDESAATTRIDNYGTIRGQIGILVETDPAAGANTGAQIVTNFAGGRIEGLGGTAWDLGAGADLVRLDSGSVVLGDGVFGDDDDTMTFAGLFNGTVGGHGAIFDGGAGTDAVSMTDYLIGDVVLLNADGAGFSLTLAKAGQSFTAFFTNWETFRFGGTTYSTDELRAIAPVPLPAGALLLLGALGGLALVRRRRPG